MKKRARSLLSVLLLALLLTNMISAYAGAAETPAADAENTAADTAIPASWTAFMMYSAEQGGWALYEATEGVNTVEFLGDGIYDITLKGADIGATGKADKAQVFLIDIPDFVAALDAQGKNYMNYTDNGSSHDASKHGQPTDLTIKLKVFVDGQEIRCKSELLNYGDIEEKGTFRIEIYNIWGLHGAAITEDPPVIAEAICPESEIRVQFTIQGTGYNTDAGAAAIEAANPTPTPVPAATQAPKDDSKDTSAPASSASDDGSEGSSNIGIIIGIAAAVVVAAGVVIVLVTRKKK